MKLNFWQWLGLILLVIGVALYVYKHTKAPSADTSNSGTAPVVQPTR